MTKKFIICEVEVIEEDESPGRGLQLIKALHHDFVHSFTVPEEMIIDGDRLRYAPVCCGDTYFASEGWVVCEEGPTIAYGRHLILDPPKEKSEWDEWAYQLPTQLPDESAYEYRERIISWLKRMPR